MNTKFSRIGAPADPNTPARLMVITTSDLSLTLMRGQLAFLRESGFDVTVVSSPGEHLEQAAQDAQIRAIAIPMAREISPAADLIALWRVYRTVRRETPAITISGTPKAGLLGGLAAWLARVPCRVYFHRGLRAETASGVERMVLLLADKLACAAAQRVICVSESLRQMLFELRLASPAKAIVLGSGSSNGVDAERFAPTPARVRESLRIREELGIPSRAPVIGFVGRLTRDKGIAGLLQAFRRLQENFQELRLLVLGDFEAEDALPEGICREIESNSRIVRRGFTSDIAPYYHAMDLLVLPTRREGFPNVILEAHAAAKPVVAMRATGTIDAVRDGMDGILVAPGNFAELANAMARLLANPELAKRMGQAGRERAMREFAPRQVWQALAEEYTRLLRARPARAEETLARARNRGRKRARSFRAVSHLAKRAMDVAGALAGLVLLSPLLALIAAAIRLTMGAPVLFRQIRPGYLEKRFELLKFRTMRDGRNASGELLPDGERITRLGKLLRRLSLDELPELWNVLCGEMSLVGPRPLLTEYLERYSAEQARRHHVKPGITGWAQVNGRNALAWEQKFALDLWYVEHRSLMLDLRILRKTLGSVVSGRDIAHSGHSTMPKFAGNAPGKQ